MADDLVDLGFGGPEDPDEDPMEVLIDSSILGDLGESLGITEDMNADGASVFGSQESSLSQYMESVNPVLDIDTELPRKEDLLASLREPTAPTVLSSAEEFGTTIHRQVGYSEQDGPTIAVGRELDDEGHVMDTSHRVSREDIAVLRGRIADRIPEVLADFEPFNPDPAKMEQILKSVEVLLRSGNMTPNRVSPTPVNVQGILDELVGLGPLAPLAKDPEVSDIIVAAHDRIFVERSGLMYRVEGVSFENLEHYKDFIERITVTEGRQISPVRPLLDMHLSDGSRVNIVGPPLTDGDEYLLTIRRFRAQRFKLHSLLELGTINEQMELYLADVMAARANVLLYGGTGAGKTATAEALISAKLPEESIITCEDTRELKLDQTNWRAMTTRFSEMSSSENIDMRRLIKNALRMRPDSIIIGETRDATAYDILVAMNSGHNGCMTTVHANNSHSALRKFEMLARQAEEKPPPETLRESICDCFDVVVGIQRQFKGERIITSIDEVVGYNVVKDAYEIRNVFRYVSVNRPNEPPRHKFVKNPKYYTIPNLQQKLWAAQRTYVPAPDGAGEEFSGDLLSDEVLLEEREAERLRLEQSNKEQQDKLRQFREAMRKRTKLQRKQQREDQRKQAAARFAAEREEARRIADEERDRQRREKKLRQATEKAQRRADGRLENARRRVEAEMAEEQRQLAQDSLRLHIDAEVARFEQEKFRELAAQGTERDEARRVISILSGVFRNEMEDRYRNLNGWQRRNMVKAKELYDLVEGGMSFDEVARQRGVTVNNVLKYVRILDNDMVNAYLAVRKDMPARDEALETEDPTGTPASPVPASPDAEAAAPVPPAERDPLDDLLGDVAFAGGPAVAEEAKPVDDVMDGWEDILGLDQDGSEAL